MEATITKSNQPIRVSGALFDALSINGLFLSETIK